MAVTNLVDLFTDIADAIRGKDGTSADICAEDFPTRIIAIPSGGGHVTIALSGNLNYLDFQGQWDSAFTDNNIDLTFTNVREMANAFNGSTLTSIDLTGANYLSSSQTGYVSNLTNFCNGCTNLTSISVPDLEGTNGLNAESNMFANSPKLRTISMPDYTSKGMPGSFNSCFSLRQVPFPIQSGQPTTINTPGIYGQLFYNCYTLDEVTNLGVIVPGAGANIGKIITNAFSMAFSNCMRLKKLTFATDSGTPKTVNWTNQVIELNSGVGYATNVALILNYNSGITADKRVTDATSYNALKNDPDWFTTDLAYSRYNHDSAVETLNSLPDTSAFIATQGGTNTIKFKGASGASTDGGAINTLTSAEIAVATAKGWTVTLV